jgi:hypothetical protein
MAQHRLDPSAQIPEADLLEQQAPLDPQSLTDAQTEWALHHTLSEAVDEADLLEQQTLVPGEDEDDYPYDPSAAGWS